MLIRYLLHNVGVWLKFFKNRNFSHSCRWDTFIFIFQFDFFQGYYFFSISISCLEDNTICSFTNGLDSLVIIHLFKTQLTLNLNNNKHILYISALYKSKLNNSFKIINSYIKKNIFPTSIFI